VTVFDFFEEEHRRAAESLDAILFSSCVKVPCSKCGCEISVTEDSSKDEHLCDQCLNPWDYMHNPDELEKLVWEMPTTKVAELFGVSDVAVGKRCKKHGIKKPPRGYWAKVNAGHLPAPRL
jgi:hypothetical protein